MPIQVSVSFTASEVQFAARPGFSVWQSPLLEWHVRLPGVGWISPAVPANPGPASYAGYDWNPAAIIELPAGEKLNISGTLEVNFEFDYPRGMTSDSKTPSITLVQKPIGVAAQELTQELTQEPVSKRLTILEQLLSLGARPGQAGVSDMFLAALAESKMVSGFRDSDNILQFVFAPTNNAFRQYLESEPYEALELLGPTNRPRLWARMERWIKNLPPWHALGPGRHTDELQQAVGDDGTLYECADGWLFMSNLFHVKAAVQQAIDRILDASTRGGTHSA